MITSNIKDVIGRVKRLETELPEALARAVAPQYWQPRLKLVAEKTLRSLWALERSVARRELFERLTPVIVESMEAVVVEGGVTFSMGTGGGSRVAGGVSEAAGNVEQAAGFNLAQRTPGGKVSRNFRMPAEDWTLHAENLDRVRQGILEWVRLEKLKDERDANLTDEQIAERLELIMGLSKDTSPKDYSAAMQDAGERLAALIQSFMEGEPAGGSPAGATGPVAPPMGTRPTLDPEEAREWLGAVLAAWRAVIVASLPARVKLEIGKIEYRK